MSVSDNASARETVLVVDDNLHTSAIVKDSVIKAGFECVVSSCSQDVLRIVEEGKADLVLFDFEMADRDNFSLIKQIKKTTGQSYLPVIFLSVSEVRDKRAKLVYADDYLKKPFSCDEFLACIKPLLRIRRLQRQIILSKAGYKCLYENFPSMYVTIDSTQTIIDCNRYFCKTLGMKREEIEGGSIFSFFREDRESLEVLFNSLASEDFVPLLHRNFHLSGPDGTPSLMVKLNAIYVGYWQANSTIIITMNDITQQLRLEEEQKLARKQLYRSARLASIGTLASGVAHEINNPLTAILGFSSSILERMKNNEPVGQDELHQYLQIIYSEALRCRDTIENLSRFAKDSGIQTMSVILHDCIDDAVKLLQPRAVKTGINIVNKISSDVVVMADSARLSQVFVNLLSNCLDFCPSGSEVIIELSVSHDPSRYYCVQVSDNGPGIKPEAHSKLFDPFFTTKEVGAGAGLGLAICHNIMEDYNGSIEIESELSKGTKVTLEIPVEKKVMSDGQG